MPKLKPAGPGRPGPRLPPHPGIAGHPGSRLHWRGLADAPRARPAVVRHRLGSEVAELLLEPERSSTAACQLRIPSKLAAGLHAVSLVGEVNGGLWHRKTFFRIED